MSDSETPRTTALQASLSFTSSWSLLKLMSIELVMLSNYLILCCPFLLLPSIFPSIRVFSNELALRIKWPKYWNFSFSISPFHGFSGLTSFRMDWFDLLEVQGTFKSFLQHHSLKASIIWLQPSFWSSSHIHTLIMWAIVGKVMSLLFTTLPGFVISSLPRSKCLLISWLPSLSAVILEPKKRKSVIVTTFSPSICHEVMGPDA